MIEEVGNLRSEFKSNGFGQCDALESDIETALVPGPCTAPDRELPNRPMLSAGIAYAFILSFVCYKYEEVIRKNQNFG